MGMAVRLAVSVEMVMGMLVLMAVGMSMGVCMLVGVGDAVVGVLVGMGVGMLMVVSADMVMMNVHMKNLLGPMCLSVRLLYNIRNTLSKYLFSPDKPPGGLAAEGFLGYNTKNVCQKEGGRMSDHIHDHVHDHEHAYQHAHGIAHSHGHVHENQKAVVNRLARAIGHLEKVKRMVEEGYDCSEVLIQLAAVRSALDNTGKVILKDHMRHCMVDAVTAGDEDAIDDLCQAIDKFMK